MRIAPLLLALVALPVHAVTLSFDGVGAGAPVGEHYAEDGVHFLGSDDGLVWAGRSQGDPGAWGIEGRNGSAFLGFNGQSYELAARFDAPVRGLRLDVSSSAGSEPGARFTVAGYRNGELVEQETVELGEVDEWVTTGIDAEVDHVGWWGSDDRFHPFGVDNLRFVPADVEPFGVDLEVRPGTEKPLDLLAGGLMGAIVYGDPGFDAEEVDEATLAIGPDGAGVASMASVHFNDVDEDGFLDLVALYRLDETGLDRADAEICLTGETFAGEPFEGCVELLVLSSAE